MTVEEKAPAPLPIRLDPRSFEGRLVQMCEELEYFRNNGGTFSQNCDADKLSEALSGFHQTVVKPLIDDDRRLARAAAKSQTRQVAVPQESRP